MGIRLESTSGAPMGSGSLPIHEGTQLVVPSASARRAHLPERYGIPLLELLVVDPYFIFISWEITSQQLDQARYSFGNDFDTRRLRVSLFDAEDGSLLGERELYGDVGRWFIQLNLAGVWLHATLAFVHNAIELPLIEAGPVFIPRDTPVEPESWEEILVSYSRSEKGELRLDAVESIQSAQPAPLLLSFAGPSAGAGTPPAYRRVNANLLRPLMPHAPASVEDPHD